jgi:hypothetical protein
MAVACFTLIVYRAIVCFVVWLGMRLVNAHERMAAAQERSADALLEIARKPGSQT